MLQRVHGIGATSKEELENTKAILEERPPVQIEIIPIGDEKNFAYAEQIKQELKRNMIRTHIDTRDERLSYKIRDAQINKIPYQLVLGNTESESKQITYRKYGSDEQTTISFDKFKELLATQIKDKK
ncbi:hypothetical protein FQA39_LY12967 [Lamprigera yunnana]|nr:hypothetical protein FQA39_LY12967 [Lamprigera yunnana]